MSRTCRVGIDGARVESVLELANVALNKNTVPGDKSAFIPGGIRVGTPALTSRGFAEEDFAAVAEFIHRGVGIAKEINGADGVGRKLADFKARPPHPAPASRPASSVPLHTHTHARTHTHTHHLARAPLAG